jgi:hypothetical protein
MNREFGPATIYVNGEVIGECEVSDVNIEYEENDYSEIDLKGYSGEVSIDFTAGTIETPKEDPRIGSRVLHRYFKSVTLGKRLYGDISRSLDKLGVKK